MSANLIFKMSPKAISVLFKFWRILRAKYGGKFEKVLEKTKERDLWRVDESYSLM